MQVYHSGGIGRDSNLRTMGSVGCESGGGWSVGEGSKRIWWERRVRSCSSVVGVEAEVVSVELLLEELRRVLVLVGGEWKLKRSGWG